MSTGHIARRGKRSWRIKYDLPRGADGERRIAYATVNGLRADAERELRKRLTAVDKGIHVEPSALTVAEFLSNWLEEIAPASVSPKSLERYRGLVRNQIEPHLGTVLLQKLSPADVSAWLRKLEKTKLSTRSIRHAHGVLRTALAYAASVELIERNVASLIRPPKVERKAMQILDAKVIADVLSKLEGLSIYPVAVLAFTTGARRGEMAGLQWKDVDLDSGTVRIERAVEQTKDGLRIKPPKTAAGRRTVSLPALAVQALRDHHDGQEAAWKDAGLKLKESDFVFGKPDGGTPNPYSMSDRWRDAVRTRKLPKVTFHALRHSHASALIAAGLDVVSVSRRLGHASPSLTLSVYSHLFHDKDDKAAKAIDDALSS
jgi:integrase